MKKYLDLILSALAAAGIAGGTIIGTGIRDWWAIGAASVVAGGTAVVQQLRQSPIRRKEWTHNERNEKLKSKEKP